MPCELRVLCCSGTCEVLDVNAWVPVSFALTPEQKCILCGLLLTALVLLILQTGQHQFTLQTHSFCYLLGTAFLLTFAYRYVTAVA